MKMVEKTAELVADGNPFGYILSFWILAAFLNIMSLATFDYNEYIYSLFYGIWSLSQILCYIGLGFFVLGILVGVYSICKFIVAIYKEMSVSGEER